MADFAIQRQANKPVPQLLKNEAIEDHETKTKSGVNSRGKVGNARLAAQQQEIAIQIDAFSHVGRVDIFQAIVKVRGTVRDCEIDCEGECGPLPFTLPAKRQLSAGAKIFWGYPKMGKEDRSEVASLELRGSSSEEAIPANHLPLLPGFGLVSGWCAGVNSEGLAEIQIHTRQGAMLRSDVCLTPIFRAIGVGAVRMLVRLVDGKLWAVAALPVPSNWPQLAKRVGKPDRIRLALSRTRGAQPTPKPKRKEAVDDLHPKK